MKIKFSFILLSTILVGSIFLFTQNVWSVNSDIVVNEVCPTGCASTDNQWLEIYNKGNEPVDIFGWKFWENLTNHGLELVQGSTSTLNSGEYAVIVQKNFNFVPAEFKVFDSSWGSLNKSGEEIGLKYDSDNFVDGPFIYPEITNNFSLEKINNNNSSSDISNWKEHPSSNTLGTINYWTTYIPPVVTSTPVNQSPVVVINGPTSTEVGVTTTFDGGDSSDPDGTVASYEWQIDGIPSGSESIWNYRFTTSGNFTVNLLVTDNLGLANSTSLNILVNSVEEITDEIVTSTATSSEIIYLNEFLSDPSTSTEPEWVELFNPTSSTINLIGWTLSDSTGLRNSPTGTILAGNYFVIELNNILNNGGDSIILKNSAGEIIDSVIYGNSNLIAPVKGNSLARNPNSVGNWQETTFLTKNLSNIIVVPLVVTQQTSSGGSSIITQNTNQTNNYSSTGQIIINELFPNPEGSDTENEFVELKNIGPGSINLQDWVLADVNTKYKIKEGLINPGNYFVLKRSLTNISLNNSGGEEIKLFNPAGSLVDSVKYSGIVEEEISYAKKIDSVFEWTIKSTSGLDNIFVSQNLSPVLIVNFPLEVETGETIVFDATDTIDPEGGRLNFVWTTGSEEKNGEIVKFVFDRAGKRVVTLKVTDDYKNIVEKKLYFTVVSENEEQNVDQPETIQGEIASKTKKSSGSSHLLITNLSQIKNSQPGDLAKVSGVVAVEPGVFGSQYFYIIDQMSSSTGSPQVGVQIYSNKKDFPSLKIGDEIFVNGEISEVNGEKRIKIKTKSNINKIGQGDLFTAKMAEISEINEDFIGSLVQIQGEVTESKSTYLYLDDGTEEIKVAVKKGTGIDIKMYQVGDNLKLSGIISAIKNGWQILPRSSEDFEKLTSTSSTIISSGVNNNPANVAQTYLTATAGGLTSILLGLFAKARGRLVLNIARKTGRIVVSFVRRNPKV